MRTRSMSALVLAAALGTAGTSWAQTATGQITGTISDATGAALAGARIKVTSELTGLARETTTSDKGSYSVPLLPVGVYLVTAEKEGFKLAASATNELKVDQVLRVDLILEVGAMSETVQVTWRAIALASETASIGQAFTQRLETGRPLNARSFQQMLYLHNGR